MKSEDELLLELSASLARYTGSRMRLQRADPAAYPLVDHEFYNLTARRLSNLGFNWVGDFVPSTGHPSDGNMRCFARAFIAHNGPYMAACYHPRPKFWLSLLSRILQGRLGKVVEFETEFIDSTWVISTTVPKTRLFDPPPLLLREHFPAATSPEALYRQHQLRVAAYIDSHPGIIAKRVYDFPGMERAQARLHDISAIYREMLGGLTADEMRRFSLFGRSRSAALKERLHACTAQGAPLRTPTS